MRIGSAIATAALVAGSLGIAVGPADAAGRQGNQDFNPTLDKVTFKKILAQADDINRRTTVKLMVDRNGTWQTLKVWNPQNARPRNFAETVTVKRVGNLNRYTLRIVKRNLNGRVIQVQDSNGQASRSGGGSSTGGGGPLGGLGL